MAPSILVVGATGNTGKGVMETLPRLLKQSENLSHHRILALTRSKESVSSRGLAALENAQVIEQNWTEITADWLRKHEVERVFIASHNEPTQFAEEGHFLLQALMRVYTVEYIHEYRKTGKPGRLGLLMDEKAQVGVIEASEVGVVAAHLLVLDDTTTYNNARLVLNGPEDITGEDIVKLVESHTGSKVLDVQYRDVSWIHAWVDATTTGSKSVIRSVVHAPETAWAGQCKASTTSPEVLRLAAPKITAKQSLTQMLDR